MEQFFQWLQDSSLGAAVRADGNLFPLFESMHVVAITAAVGCIFVMDLRLVGLVWTNRPINKVIGDNVPIVWIAFVVALITGFALFVSNAVDYMRNPWFVWKLAFMGLAFVNQLVFHAFTGKDLANWGPDFQTPPSAQVAGAISLALWVAVVACGRMIGFSMLF